MLRLLAAISLIIATLASAQGEESDTRQGCISPTFRTLHIRHADDMWAPPVINLNNNSERIAVSFDELADEHRYLRYSLTHCDAEWMSEGLVDSEFLDSFNEGTVDNYEYSQATVCIMPSQSLTTRYASPNRETICSESMMNATLTILWYKPASELRISLLQSGQQ